jgi:hypothetical protein
MARLRIHDTPGDRAREQVILRLVETEAEELALEVGRSGWTRRAIAWATRCADTLLGVFGPNGYRIIRLPHWGRPWGTAVRVRDR